MQEGESTIVAIRRYETHNPHLNPLKRGKPACGIAACGLPLQARPHLPDMASAVLSLLLDVVREDE